MVDAEGWPSPDDTQDLLNEIEQGSDGAVDRLLNRHRQALRTIVQRRMDRALSRRVDASDIVQDVLLEASRRLQVYVADPRMPFHIWLRQLARDRIIDMHRRHREAQRRSLDREQPLVGADGKGDDANRGNDDFVDDELTPAAANIRRELQQRFAEALEDLSADDRDLILMRHFEQLSNGEVAQLLEISPAAAGMRHLRALRRLRDILGTDPFEDG